jgi:hypothetical protein
MPPDDPLPRRRGRPLKDPDRGPASDAERAASRRLRADEEIIALAVCLRSAMHHLEDAGHASDANGWMFWADKEKALAAVRRRIPWIADDLAAMEQRGKTQSNEFRARENGSELTPGKRKGSIIVEGSEFWIDPAGKIMQEGRTTRLRVNREYNCWVVVDVDSVNFKPRRHYLGQGRAMALLDAALIVLADDASAGATHPPET